MIKSKNLLIILFWILSLNLTNCLYGQSGKSTEVIWTSNSNIRSISENFLGNPNLWPLILNFNNLASLSELTSGKTLIIPQGEVLRIIESFASTEKIIAAAIDNGARIFANDDIETSISFFNKALEERANNNLNGASKLIRESEIYALKASNLTLQFRNQAADAFLSRKKGTVQYRKPEYVSWNNAPMFNKLFEQDLTRTLSSSFAEITFSDLNQIRLNENSQAVILRSRINLLNNKTETQVKLEKGDAYAKLFSSPKKDFNLEVPGVKTKISSELFWVDKQETETKFANYKGEISLEAQGRQVTLKENQGSVVPKDKPPSPASNLLPPPELISPEMFNQTFERNITLNWQSVPEAQNYQLEISTDHKFSSLFQIEPNIKTNSFILSGLPQGAFYWRVASVDNLGLPGKFSNPSVFTINIDFTPPFLELSIAENTTFTINNEFEVEIKSEPGCGLIINDVRSTIGPGGLTKIILRLSEGSNFFEFTAVDGSGNKTSLRREIIAELNPIMEILDKDKNYLQEKVFHVGRTENFSGYTRPFSKVELLSAKSKLSSAVYADNDGYFTLAFPRARDEEYILKITSRAGYYLEKTILVRNN